MQSLTKVMALKYICSIHSLKITPKTVQVAKLKVSGESIKINMVSYSSVTCHCD